MTVIALCLCLIILIITILAIKYKPKDHSQYDHPKTPLIKQANELSDGHAAVLEKLVVFQQQQTLDIKQARRTMEELFGQDVDADIKPVDVDGIAAEWVLASGADPSKRLLYLHGGAFRVGSPKSHRYITAEISKRAGVAVLAIDYRMQPEFKVTDCHADAQTAYRWILSNGPDGSQDAPRQLFVSCDSAGGNLTLSVIAWARDKGLPQATAAVAMAPLTDATLSSASWQTNMATDPFLGPAIGKLIKMPKFLIAITSRFTSGAAVNTPLLSPLLGNLDNLPDTLIQVSRDEMLFDDSQRYYNKAISAGSKIELQVWPKMVHVFQAFGPDLQEANEALDNIGDYIRSFDNT